MKKGFTLIEIMVVIVIMGVLAAVGVPKLFGMIAKAKASEVPTAAGTYVHLQEAYQSEKTIKDLGDKVTPEEKGTVNTKIDELKKAKDGDDAEAIQKAIEALSTAMQPIGVRLYQQANAQQGGNANPGNGGDAGQSGKKDGDTVDAEFTD